MRERRWHAVAAAASAPAGSMWRGGVALDGPSSCSVNSARSGRWSEGQPHPPLWPEPRPGAGSPGRGAHFVRRTEDEINRTVGESQSLPRFLS
eukprot:COSAG01_NODE_2182_length_8212_cov_7.046838_8_plen_93_part_00